MRLNLLVKYRGVPIVSYFFSKFHSFFSTNQKNFVSNLFVLIFHCSAQSLSAHLSEPQNLKKCELLDFIGKDSDLSQTIYGFIQIFKHKTSGSLYYSEYWFHCEKKNRMRHLHEKTTISHGLLDIWTELLSIFFS